MKTSHAPTVSPCASSGLAVAPRVGEHADLGSQEGAEIDPGTAVASGPAPSRRVDSRAVARVPRRRAPLPGVGDHPGRLHRLRATAGAAQGGRSVDRADRERAWPVRRPLQVAHPRSRRRGGGVEVLAGRADWRDPPSVSGPRRRPRAGVRGADHRAGPAPRHRPRRRPACPHPRHRPRLAGRTRPRSGLASRPRRPRRRRRSSRRSGDRAGPDRRVRRRAGRLAGLARRDRAAVGPPRRRDPAGRRPHRAVPVARPARRATTMRSRRHPLRPHQRRRRRRPRRHRRCRAAPGLRRPS